jgi:hypothetical protein
MRWGKRNRPSRTGVESKQDAYDEQERIGRIIPEVIDQLAECSPETCRGAHCPSELCPLGARRRRIRFIQKALQALKRGDGPVLELRVHTPAWRVPAGELASVKLGSAKKTIRRKLDACMDHEMVAVGFFIPTLQDVWRGPEWCFEFHVVISGSSAEEVERAFGASLAQSPREPSDLEALLEEITRHQFQAFFYSSDPQIKKRGRMEFYKWLSTLPPNARLFRYGLNRHFQEIAKEPRVVKPKVTKPRKTAHLVVYQFGSDKRAQRDWEREQDERRRPEEVRIVEPPDDYYELD